MNYGSYVKKVLAVTKLLNNGSYDKKVLAVTKGSLVKEKDILRVS